MATGGAFDYFPPKPFRPLIAAARAGTLTPLLALLKSRAARSLPTAYGWLTHRDLPHDLIDQWVAAYFADKSVRRDLRRLTAAPRRRLHEPDRLRTSRLYQARAAGLGPPTTSSSPPSTPAG